MRHLYWGPRLPRVEDLVAGEIWPLSSNDLAEDLTPEEYPIHGGFRYGETCLSVRFPDGSREVRAVVDGMAVEDEGVVVALRDGRGVGVELHYWVLPELDLIERWAVVANTGEEPLAVAEAASAGLHISRRNLILHNVAGHWAAEQQGFTQRIGPGKVVLEARRGISTHHHNPYVVLDDDATENTGDVWFAALAWSGNFRAVVEQRQFADTRVILGWNPWDSEITLAPRDRLTTPTVVAGYSDAGLAAMSHRLHDYGNALLDPRPRPVLYNSWEATEFAVDLDGQLELARRAARIGVELFVIDDGWFGRRDSIDDGLGDWWVSPGKFPDGLTPLIDHVRGLGMEFGIWLEPEMVSPASDLYAAHPDWIYRDPGVAPDTARGQYVLDLTRADVQAHLFEVLDRLLTENDIAYLKWDANRPMSAVGVDRDVQRRHIAAVYDLVGRLKAAHPGILVEACASGGGRIDFGALRVFDDVWTSDNTDAADRLVIQRGYSLVYPAKAMRSWITDVPNFLTQRSIPLDFRARVAMCGSLGIGSDLSTCDDGELESLAAHVATFLRLRPVIHDGRQFRLGDPNDDYRFVGYVSRDARHAVLFAFLLPGRLGQRSPHVRLSGLDPDTVYDFTINGVADRRSGTWLAHHGVDVWLQGDYASALVEFTAVD